MNEKETKASTKLSKTSIKLFEGLIKTDKMAHNLIKENMEFTIDLFKRIIYIIIFLFFLIIRKEIAQILVLLFNLIKKLSENWQIALFVVFWTTIITLLSIFFTIKYTNKNSKNGKKNE